MKKLFGADHLQTFTISILLRLIYGKEVDLLFFTINFILAWLLVLLVEWLGTFRLRFYKEKKVKKI